MDLSSEKTASSQKYDAYKEALDVFETTLRQLKFRIEEKTEIDGFKAKYKLLCITFTRNGDKISMSFSGFAKQYNPIDFVFTFVPGKYQIKGLLQLPGYESGDLEKALTDHLNAVQ